MKLLLAKVQDFTVVDEGIGNTAFAITVGQMLFGFVDEFLALEKFRAQAKPVVAASNKRGHSVLDFVEIYIKTEKGYISSPQGDKAIARLEGLYEMLQEMAQLEERKDPKQFTPVDIPEEKPTRSDDDRNAVSIGGLIEYGTFHGLR